MGFWFAEGWVFFFFSILLDERDGGQLIGWGFEFDGESWVAMTVVRMVWDYGGL